MVLTGNRVAERRDHSNPMSFISEFMSRFKVPDLPGLPRFCGGLVGAFGYDTVRYIETKLAQRHLAKTPDPLGVPDILLLLSEEIAIVDNLSGKLTLVVYAEPGFPGAWKQAQARLKELLAKLRAPVTIPPEVQARIRTRRLGIRRGGLQGRRAPRQAVHRRWRHHAGGALAAHEQALRGEPAGAVPRAAHAEPLALHVLFQLRGLPRRRRLARKSWCGSNTRTANARHRAADRRHAQARRHAAEDEALAADLLADPKERAEHLMLLDLGRNDIGRVAKTGTVKVTDPFIIERYSHVMHIVSNVEPKLKDDEGALGVLKATFPAGTVSGAPKVRAMEIIDELEPSKRGIYAGSVGYLGFNGDMDLASRSAPR
jgi:anthranilate synthase component 1